MFILGTALFAMFLMLTLYMQQVLHFSPLKTGIGYLAVAGTAIIWANVAAAAVTRVGVKPTLVVGMSVMTVGLSCSRRSRWTGRTGRTSSRASS